MGLPGAPRPALDFGESGSLPPPHDIARLIEILAILRTPGSGCPWDLAQTHESLAPYAIEEAYELAEAISRGDVGDIRDELGDCLLQVVFHARVAEEAGAFAFADVVEAISAKMLRRHPHVFGDGRAGATSRGGGPSSWEAIKAEERRRRLGAAAEGRSLLADVASALPGLSRAVKLQERAASVGFDWAEIRLVLAKVREEIEEVEVEVDAQNAAGIADEIGDLLFAVANLARHAGVDPEAAVRAANDKFARRFAHIERALAARGVPLPEAGLGEMESLWDEAKRSERGSA